jgi:EAL domain-containing protein (putative c-di-GMP-specific phosphodiesterase class I)/CheY-like chemotaxis protein
MRKASADMHLLILDDDKAIAAFIASIASERGWTVVTSANERQFHACYLEQCPDAIFLDLQLGATDGVEQLRFLQRVGFAGQVVLMSGFEQRVLASAQSVGESLGIPIAGLLEKPVRAVRVRKILDELAQHMQPLYTEAPDVRGPHSSPLPYREVTPDDIEQALECSQTELYFQPIVSSKDFSVVRLEALLRWNHPERGLIPPTLFVPIAEQNEVVIDHLFQWVLENALTAFKQLVSLGSQCPIAINISGRNLHSLDFPDRVAAHVERSGVPFNVITLEITESVAMHDPSGITDILTRLRLKGFGLAIDDFGTGYSSLKALRQMPFSEIKIDKSFVSDICGSRDSHVIVKSVIDLARNMGLTSVAEGVETDATACVLIELGVDSLQGYHFSRPLPFPQLVDWMKAWSAPISSRDPYQQFRSASLR